MLGAGLRYHGLVANDATGRALPARLELESDTLLIRVDATDAHYPLTIDPFFQQAKLTASDGAADQSFGFCVAISGDTVVIGRPGSNSTAPGAYVFVKPAGGWATATQTAKLTASVGTNGVGLGNGVAISGDTIVAGAPGNSALFGAAYVFVKPSGGWVDATETAKLSPSNPDTGDGFGIQVAIDGDTVVVGTSNAHNGIGGTVPGIAYVFVKPAGGWGNATENAKLTASDGANGDYLGISVGVAGDVAVAGALGDDSSRGAAYVYVKPPTGWVDTTQTAKLTASDSAVNDQMGDPVAIDGDTIVAAAASAKVGGNTEQGAVYVFAKPVGGWVDGTQAAKLTASDGGAGDELGFRVAISGDTVVGGARGATIGGNVEQGAAYVFTKPSAGWANGTESAKLSASDGTASDFFGIGVGISGATVVAGASGQQSYQGAAYVFTDDTIAPTTSIALNPSSPNGLLGWYITNVHATVSASDNAGGSGVADTRCVLDPVSVPNTFDDLPGGCAYTGAGGDVASDGSHTLYAASRDNAGNKETPVASVTFSIDQTPPTVTCGAPPTFTLGGPGGSVGATVTDTTSGPAASPISGTGSDTSSVGVKTAPLTGFDKAGNSTTVGCSYIVAYQVVGFFSPLPKEAVNGGSKVAVKFALADNSGARIPDAEAQSLAAACNAQIVFTAGTPSPNCFTYEPRDKQFVFTLKTPKGSAGLQTITANVLAGATVINTLTTQINLK